MSSLRTLIRVDIRIDQQWAIGAASDLHYRPSQTDGAQIRLPVQRDPKGGLSLPATSLIGSLARHLGSDDWLGSASGSDTVPSQLRCLAATIHLARDASPVEVTTTAINAYRRSAEQRTLRTEELLDPAEITWWLEWDHHDDELELNDLVDKLIDWRPIVGRHRSANRGRAFVQAVHHRTFDLADEVDLTWWLAERPRFAWRSPAKLPNPQWTGLIGLHQENSGRKLLTCRFTVADALHIGGDGRQRAEGDREVTQTRQVIPSTSWRGIFRHRVRHIVRVSSGDEELVEAVTARLFGTGRAGGASPEAGYRGQLRFGDSPVNGIVRQRTHVAIDRITGGAAQLHAEDPLDDVGLLFTIEHFGPGTPVELVIYNDSDTSVSGPDRDLLEAVIRDLDEGIIGVGGLTSRGYGTLKLDGRIQWEDDNP